MRYRIGRFLQLVGLLLLPIALAGNMARPELVDVKVMLVLSGAGIGVFAIGWLIQQGARPK